VKRRVVIYFRGHFRLALARGLDERFHVIQIFFEGTAAGGGEAKFGFRHAACERFGASDVPGVFEFARVNAEVAIARAEKFFELVEREGGVHGERADDGEARAFVNQPIEICGAGFLLARGR